VAVIRLHGCPGYGGYISSPVSFGLKAASKVMINPGLFHDRICHVPGLYFTIYRKILISNGAIPHIMLTLAMPHKITAMFRQFFRTFFSYSAITPPRQSDPP
jgi:hypothetical protein